MNQTAKTLTPPKGPIESSRNFSNPREMSSGVTPKDIASDAEPWPEPLETFFLEPDKEPEPSITRWSWGQKKSKLSNISELETEASSLFYGMVWKKTFQKSNCLKES